MDALIILVVVAIFCLRHENKEVVTECDTIETAEKRVVRGNPNLIHEDNAFMEVANRLGFDRYGNTTNNSNVSRRI